MKRIQLLLSSSLLGCIISGQSAYAQDAAPRAADAQPNRVTPDDSALREIIVTAERKFSTAQKTAASISVRSGSDMLQQGRYELKNILEDVPGVVGGAAATVSTSQGSGTDNPAVGLVIRGVQSNSGAGGSVTSTSASAAIYVDDVYNGIGGNYDIDRVEVLRGPQGTLYGRSATSGVVAIQTANPSTKKVGVDATAEFGNYSMHHFTGDVNVPIVTDKLAVRVSGNLYKRDGYYSAQGGAVSSEAFRAKALWTPTANFSALVGYAQEYNTTHSGGVSISQGSSPTDFVYTPQEVGTGKNHFNQYWGNFKLDLGAVTINYIPAYRTWYQNANIVARGVFNANQSIITPTDSFMTHEVRIRNRDTDAKLSWQTGFMYYRNALSSANNLYNLDLASFQYKDNSRKTTTAEGGFAEATYAFTPDTRMTAGIRYDHTEVQTTEDYTSILGITQSLSGDQGLRKFNNITYKARIEHNLAPQNLLYASISTGFTPGDITLTTDSTFKPVVQTLQAQTLTAYEVGSKNRFLNNHLQINGAAFYYNYGGFQTAGINTSPQTPATPTFVTINVPMRSYGGELEVQARPWANGTFSLNGSYTNARYGDFGQYSSLFSTHTVPGVAPLQGNVAYDHRITMGDATLALRGALRFFTAHDVSRLTQDWAALGAGPYARVGSQAMGDLTATLSFKSSVTITGYVRNVTDRRYLPDNWAIAAVLPGAPGGKPAVITDRSALSDPRTFGVILNVKY